MSALEAEAARQGQDISRITAKDCTAIFGNIAKNVLPMWMPDGEESWNVNLSTKRRRSQISWTTATKHSELSEN